MVSVAFPAGTGGRWLHHAWDAVRFYPTVAVFCTGSFIWSLIGAALYRVLPLGAGLRLGQFMIMLGFRNGLRLMRLMRLARFDLGALDALGDHGPLVIACNHLSLLDAVLVISRLPRVACIAKAGLWDNPALGGSVRLAGYIRNDAPLPLIRSAVAALRGGSQLLIFPEGTRGDGCRLGPFRSGFVVMARTARVPIQTVILESDTAYLRRGWKLGRMPPFPLTYRARLGRRFEAEGTTADCVARLEHYFREAVAEGR